jgi:hypothetical protein
MKPAYRLIGDLTGERARCCISTICNLRAAVCRATHCRRR